MDNEPNKKDSNGKKLSARKNSKSSNSSQSVRPGRVGEPSRRSNSFEKKRPLVEKNDDTHLPIQDEITEPVGSSKIVSKSKIDDRSHSSQKRVSGNDGHVKKVVNIKEELTEVLEGSDTEKNPRNGKKNLKRKIEEESAASTSGASPAASDTDADDKDPSKDKKKKNRCAVCRKKVGLTGFECRCGGLFCAVHRYSDKHDCSFDYRELGAQEIRRNNPVVVSQKIHKI